MPATDPSVLESPEVEKLLILCEEVTRATPDGTKRFIEPGPNVLARAKSKQHNIVFGRRGSGKSSLLRKAAADLTIDRRPISFVDLETFKGHSYPDVLISVLIKCLSEFHGWLSKAATAPATERSFWRRLFGTVPTRAPLNKKKTKELLASLELLVSDLETQLRLPESAEAVSRTSGEVESSRDRNVSIDGTSLGAPVSGAASQSSRRMRRVENEMTYVSHKIEYLHQNILRYQEFFRELSQLSDGSSFLILDDLYHIKRADQVKVVDYFHRVAKGNNLWLKIGTIKHRSEWYLHQDPPIGMKLGDDAKEINLDVSLEQFGTLRSFLKRVLEGLLAESGEISHSALINNTALDRLIIASGGVTRDFIGVLAAAIGHAKNRGADSHRGAKVGAEDVNLSAGDYDTYKREEFKLDTAEDREELEQEFHHLVEFCTKRAKCNVFLVSQRLDGSKRNAIDQLIDLRLIHSVKSRVTLKKGAVGEIFEAFMLDLSQYTASRKVHGFEIVDLSSASKNEAIRRESLIYGKSAK